MESIPNCPNCHSEYTYHDGMQFVCPDSLMNELKPDMVKENEEKKTVKDSNGVSFSE